MLGLALALQALPTVDYRIELADPAQKRVTVTAHVAGLKPEERQLELRMAERYAFVQLPEPLLDGEIAAHTGADALEVENVAPYHWIVHRDGTGDIDFAYAVKLTHREIPEVAERDAYEHPYVAADHALLVTGAIVVAPLNPFTASVRIAGPKDWPVHAAWPEREPGVYAPPSDQDLLDSLIALGSWRASQVEVGGARVETLFAPSEASLEEVAAPLIGSIVETELELFGVRPFERFLFAFVPSDVRGFAGSAKHGAMVLSAMKGLPPDALKRNVGHLVGHEFFHTWATSRYAAPDELRFVNEGFTDFFACHVAARVGASNWDEFASSVASSIERYDAAARATKQSLVAAGGPSFFSSRDAYQQIYNGGLLIAALCELALRKIEPATDLDALMRAFNNDPRWSRRGPAPTLDDFVALLGKQTSAEFAAHVRSLLNTAEPIDFAAELRALGCSVGPNPTATGGAPKLTVDAAPWRR